ncbi:hypothetical protein HZS_2594 [Henneguya salminicola]|nr:hypothetical protein HZS_2594 [Henneguya salminicola]
MNPIYSEQVLKNLILSNFLNLSIFSYMLITYYIHILQSFRYENLEKNFKLYHKQTIFITSYLQF